jgi:hypothetical protein
LPKFKSSISSFKLKTLNTINQIKVSGPAVVSKKKRMIFKLESLRGAIGSTVIDSKSGSLKLKFNIPQRTPREVKDGARDNI